MASYPGRTGAIMARGLAIPVRVHNGKAVLVDGAEQMRKIVALGMGDGENANPFNADAGLEVPLFAPDGTASRALVRRGIDRHFARWQADDRAQLDSVTFAGNRGEVHVEVRYVDLETDEPQEVSGGYPQA